MAKTWQSMLAVLAVTSAALFTGAPAALAQDDGGGGPDPTTASTAERVSAEVLPAVAYIQVDVRATMRNQLTGGRWPAPPRTYSCTGFAVAPNGVIATAGHCVDDEDVLLDIAQVWAQEDTAAGYGDYAQNLEFYKANYKLEGNIANSPPDRTITVYRATSAGTQAGAGMLAQVVDHRGFNQGDVALLKVDATNLPTVEVTPSNAVNTGTPIMAVGYPASRDAVVDPSLAPTWKDGAISSRQNSNGVPFLEITSDMGFGMSGGPTVNDQGQVVGINSRGATDDADSSNFVVPSSTLLDLMARNGIRSEAGPVDVAYRGGLDDFYAGQYSEATDEFQRVLDIQPDNTMASEYRVKAIAAYNQFGDKGSLGLVGWLLVGGGALVVVGALLTVLLLRRSRKRRAAQAASAPVEMSQAQQPYAGSWGAATVVPTQRMGEESTPTQGFGAQATGPHSPAVGFPMPAPDRTESPTTGSVTTASLQGSAPVATATPTLTESGSAGDVPTSEAVTESPSTGFCPNCGTPRSSGGRFCGSCGHRV